MAFIVELWESVFTPGTTPALIKATHASFILLILSLIFLIFLTKSIHFINLFVISILLYASVIWFINELNQAKLKDNKQLETESTEDSNEDNSKKEDTKKVGDSVTTGSTSGAAKPVTPRKRKV